MTRRATVACLAGAGTAPELMAEAALALSPVARLHALPVAPANPYWAEHGLTLDRKSILPNACNGAGARLLVNVHFTVTNDADSGFAGNEWANRL